ncbi:MAG: hypothetical protein AUI36_24590 [Cyanobacteria bacterium 13_1_40CM_2_61_4]|nr:MAG: hypothetical protein AUI36_24590 [Cyanobacteria bacterium 13_1_40CM_2_61_4]
MSKRESLIRLQALQGLGVVKIFLGQAASAIAHYESFINELVVHGDMRTRLAAANNLGSAYWMSGDLHNAKKYLDLALSDANFLNYPKRKGNIMDVMALVQLDLGNFREALAGHRAALAIRRKIQSDLEIAMSLLNIGEAYIADGQYGWAQYYLQKSLDIRVSRLSDH